MTKDEQWMQRALDLARLGASFVMPNPLVGCVIVKNNRIIGEGWHANYGGSHAEVAAIHACKQDPEGSTAYVTLEPCSHTGKTPPCAHLLIKKNIQRVVICNVDPNPQVAGKGIQLLRAAGIEVIEGVLAEKGEQLNASFFHFHRTKKPYITIKFAQSADGFIAKENGEPVLFSNPISKQLVHQLRAEHQAILVGVNTILTDNPSLSLRNWPGKSPIRMVFDPKNRLENSTCTILADTHPCVIFTKNHAKIIGNKQWIALGEDLDFLLAWSNYCYSHEIQSVLVEGGTKTIEQFVAANMVNSYIRIESQVTLGAGIVGPTIDLPWENLGIIGETNTWYQAKS